AATRNPPQDFTPEVDQIIKERVKNYATLPENDQYEIRQQITEGLKAELTEVAPGYRRRWGVDLHTLRARLRDQPLVLRVKFHTANPNPDAQYNTVWIIGPTNSPTQAVLPEKL